MITAQKGWICPVNDISIAARQGLIELFRVSYKKVQA
jgi:hypothetical protein